MKTKVNEVWQDGVPHVKVSSVWKKAITSWTKVGGVWKPSYYRHAFDMNMVFPRPLRTGVSGAYIFRGLNPVGGSSFISMDYSTLFVQQEGNLYNYDIRLATSKVGPSGVEVANRLLDEWEAGASTLYLKVKNYNVDLDVGNSVLTGRVIAGNSASPSVLSLTATRTSDAALYGLLGAAWNYGVGIEVRGQ